MYPSTRDGNPTTRSCHAAMPPHPSDLLAGASHSPVVLVRAGSAWDRRPAVLGGHERSRRAGRTAGRRTVHGHDLGRSSPPRVGSNPSVPTALRDSVPTATGAN